MLKVPQLNSVRWFKVSALFGRPDPEADGATEEIRRKLVQHFEGAEVGVKMVDHATSDAWDQELRLMSLEERKRLSDLRSKYSETVWPELHKPRFETPEGTAARRKNIDHIIAEGTAGVRGFDGYAEKEKPDRLVYLFRVFDVSDIVATQVKRMQRLELEEVF